MAAKVVKKPFKYKLPPRPPAKFNVNRVAGQRQAEILTGFVRGQPASDLEEMYARALDRDPRLDYFEFQPSYVVGRNLPGEIRLDFLQSLGGTVTPVQIDGDWIHKTAEARALDKLQDARLDDHLRGSGVQPVLRIRIGGEGYPLETQDDFDAFVRENF